LSTSEIERRLLKVADLAVHTAIAYDSIIQVVIDHFIEDGSEIKFKAPVGCTDATRLQVQYTNTNGENVIKTFAFADANGNDVGELRNLFAEGAIVKVILDLTDAFPGVDGAAFVQNADTDAYLENRLEDLQNNVSSVGSTKTAEGSFIVIDECIKAPFSGLIIYGKTTLGESGFENIGDNGSIDIIVTNPDTNESQTCRFTLDYPVPKPLRGIPVDSNGTYTDEDGQQWIADELNMKTGKRVQRVDIIESYSDEEILTPYISSTGDLATGATVIYALDEPVLSGFIYTEIDA
jgi:hypothetical protein